MKIKIIIFFILPTYCLGQGKSIETIKFEDFSVSFPSSFEFESPENHDVVFILKSKTETKKDLFIENINLIRKRGDVDFDSFIDRVKNETAAVAKIIELNIFTEEGFKSLKLMFIISQNDIELIVVQQYFFNNEFIYLLTFTGEKTVYPEFSDRVDLVFNSFKLN